MNKEIKQRLLNAAEDGHRIFQAGLIPNINNVLGVRLPVLRKMAKEIYRCGKWKEYITDYEPEYMEETLLKGMVIGLIQDEPENILQYVKDFIPQINNWAVCDGFCCSLKFIKNNQELVWKFIQPYLCSKKEYELRFGIVVLLSFFVNEKYVPIVLEELDKIKTEDYYAQMAAAWAVSICFREFPDLTYKYLQNSNLSNWIYNKSIQKCIESLKTDKAAKDKLRKMKR